MGFNELTHAFIPADFYMHLKEAFGESCKDAFIMATCYYGEQRGRRMAQRALRDKRKLDYKAYLDYGEWLPTKELYEGMGTHSKTTSINPDYTVEVYSCPWHQMFKETGQSEGGYIYCTNIDTAIVRGFNPSLKFSMPRTIYDSPCCEQTMHKADLEEGIKYERRANCIMDFAYHTAHIYFSFKEIAEAVYQDEGKSISLKVLKDFENKYGKEMTKTLLSFESTNFNIASDDLMKTKG